MLWGLTTIQYTKRVGKDTTTNIIRLNKNKDENTLEEAELLHLSLRHYATYICERRDAPGIKRRKIPLLINPLALRADREKKKIVLWGESGMCGGVVSFRKMQIVQFLCK